MNRSIGEITFDHQQEKITENVQKGDKNRFRRNESKLKRYLYIWVYVLLPILYIFYPIITRKLISYYAHKRNDADWFYKPNDWKKLSYRILDYTTLVTGIGSFSYLVHLVKRYHRLEYETNIKSMSILFVNVFIIIVAKIYQTESQPS